MPVQTAVNYVMSLNNYLVTLQLNINLKVSYAIWLRKYKKNLSNYPTLIRSPQLANTLQAYQNSVLKIATGCHRMSSEEHIVILSQSDTSLHATHLEIFKHLYTYINNDIGWYRHFNNNNNWWVSLSSFRVWTNNRQPDNVHTYIVLTIAISRCYSVY